MVFWNASAVRYKPLTPSDTVDEAAPFRALYIGKSGDVILVGLDGVAVPFRNHPIGPLSAVGKRVNATGTSAADIVALY
jgi:hypothetical protein